MDEQEEKNQASSFEKQSHGKALNKLNDLQRKNKKVNKIVTLIKTKKIIIPLLIILGVVVLFVMWGNFVSLFYNLSIGSTNSAKKAAISTSYSTDSTSPETGNQNETPNGDTSVSENRVVVKPTKDKDAYEITNNYTSDEIKKLREELEKDTSRDISEFSDFEISIIGALAENGLDIDDWNIAELKCFPAFIKAEACTQYLDLRPNSQKFKDGKYVPEKVDKNGNKIPGVILVQRTNTNSNTSVTLEYMQESEFNKLVDANDEKAINYFTVNEKGNLVIAKWYMEEITVNGDYPENLPEIEKEKSTGKVYTIIADEIAYSQLITQYTMPFELLVQLLAILEDPDFCMELADYAMESKIVVNIQEEETTTHTVEEKTYTVHSKDEKRIDYQIASVVEIEKKEDYLLVHNPEAVDDKGNVCTNYEVNEKKVTVDREYTSHTYNWRVIEADTWISHYTESYTTPTTKNETTSDTVKDLPDKYTEINTDKQPITDSNETIKDKDVKEFKDEKEEYYKNLITIPKVKLELGTKYIWDPVAKQYIEIPGDNKITITPEDKIQSPWTSKEYKADEDLPSTINVTIKANGSLPQITFPFTLKNSNYATSYTKEQIAQCNVTKLDIKEFERIDTVNIKTEDVTIYESDSNPIKNVDLYDKADEKFLKSYDKSKRAQHMMNSVSSWLFEAMENDGATEKFCEIIKYLLYKYDGTDYGVTELDLSMFEPDEFITATGGGSALWNNDITKDEFINTVKNYIVPSGSGKYGTYKWGYERYFIPNAENFYDIATSYGLDPRFIFCIGIHESGFGTSAIANEKGNFFGWNANDSNPYGDASSFYDMSSGIETVCKGLANQYVSSNGSWYQWIIDKGYNPTTIQGIGCRYASDPNWANAVIKHMRNIFNYEPGFAANGSFLAVAKECHDYIRQNNYSYIQGTTIPADENSVSGIDCSAYVTWVLYEYGYTELKGHQKTCSWFMNTSTMQKMGWTVLPATQAEAGDIVVNSHHMEIYAGDGKFYNAGSTEAIRREISNCGVGYLNDFTYAIRVTPPGGI